MAVVLGLVLLLLVHVVREALWGIPHVWVEETSDGVVVHFERLGEYPTSLQEVTLEERETGTVVWHLVADGPAPQRHNLELHPGSNPAHLPGYGSRRFRVLVPAEADTFVLESGVVYRLRLDSDAALTTTGKAEFEF